MAEKDQSATNKGDEAPRGTPDSGDDVCPVCHGTGRIQGGECENCGGSGKIIRVIGGA